MHLANVTLQNNDNHERLSENVLKYVNLACSKYNIELVHEMLFWTENQKRITSEEERIRLIPNLLNKRKIFAHDIAAFFVIIIADSYG